MKTLFLVRHAKSSWDDPSARQRPAIERPWQTRCAEDGKRLAKRDVKPELILSSPAMRALATAEIIARKLDYKIKSVVVDARLYAGDADELLNVIHRLDDELESV